MDSFALRSIHEACVPERRTPNHAKNLEHERRTENVAA
jgi:hypothetical protein